MEETLVSFETAKLLKEKGFNDTIGLISGKHYYNYKGELDGDCLDQIKYRMLPYSEIYDSISAPTLSLAQKWLREVYDCYIVITPEPYIEGINFNWQVLFYDNTSFDCWSDKSTGMYGDNGEHPTHESALELGLFKALLLITNK